MVSFIILDCSTDYSSRITVTTVTELQITVTVE